MKIPHLSLLLVTTCLIMLPGISGCNNSGGYTSGPEPDAESSLALKVRAIPVVLDEWKSTIPISGNLQTQSIVDVKAEVAGRLVEVEADDGDLVRKGDLLAKIDDTNYQLAFRQADAALKVTQAAIERANVSYEYTKNEKERADNLLKTGGITQKDHQAAITGMREAEAQLKLAQAQSLQAEAALAITEKALRDCVIYAPSDGHVQKLWTDEGSLLNPGSTVFTIVDNGQLELESIVPSYYLPDIRQGLEADFNTPSWGMKNFSGFVTSINPVVKMDNRSLIVKIKVENTGLQLRTGMYARGNITSEIKIDVPVIPRDALIPEENASEFVHVYVVEEGFARRRRVLVGGKSQDRVWIREGLAPGDLLVVEQGPAIKDGSKVQIVVEDADYGS